MRVLFLTLISLNQTAVALEVAAVCLEIGGARAWEKGRADWRPY